MSDGMWACSHCGPHPNSSATWCAKGCGRDYNRMYLAAAHGSTEYWQQVATLVTDDLRASKAEVSALTAENAALRDALEKLSNAFHPGCRAEFELQPVQYYSDVIANALKGVGLE